jgi:hypothetical protein
MERMVGAVLLPQAGREQMNLEGRMGSNTLEYIHEIDIRIDPSQPTPKRARLWGSAQSLSGVSKDAPATGVTVG